MAFFSNFGDFHNNHEDSDKDEDVNSGNDTIFVENLVWEDIDGGIFMQNIPDHYCVTYGFKEVVENLFQDVLVCIMLTSGMYLEYFRQVTEQ